MKKDQKQLVQGVFADLVLVNKKLKDMGICLNSLKNPKRKVRVFIDRVNDLWYQIDDVLVENEDLAQE